MEQNKKLIDQFDLLIQKLTYEKDGAKVNRFKIINFKKVVKILESFQRPITCIDDVKNIKGIGAGSLERIEQFLKTGSFVELNNTSFNNSTNDLLRITGVGPVKAKALSDKGFTLESILKMKKEIELKYLNITKLKKLKLLIMSGSLVFKMEKR